MWSGSSGLSFCSIAPFMTLRVTHIFRSYLKFVPNAKLLGIITGMFVPEALFVGS